MCHLRQTPLKTQEWHELLNTGRKVTAGDSGRAQARLHGPFLGPDAGLDESRMGGGRRFAPRAARIDPLSQHKLRRGCSAI